MHQPCIKTRSLMNYTNPMHHLCIKIQFLMNYTYPMHHLCIKIRFFNILYEFIHIICIENKETILIGVTSGSDTTVKFLLAIKHKYTVEKFEISPFSNTIRDPCDPIR